MPKTKEWTLMFYFASDNPLGPTIVSQLKALKQAGFHPEANVIAYYDPPVPGTPTHIFDVNITERIRAHGESRIGFRANNSWVDNLVEDKLWGDQVSNEGTKIKKLIADGLEEDRRRYNPPDPHNFRTIKKGKNGKQAIVKVAANHRDDAQSPERSLREFLRFCSESYPARNYMLFILGHGLVVGNDLFLYDESAATHSLSLAKLGSILGQFKKDIKKNVGEKAEFQLVSFHSCSMSSLEVAYELKNSANYMLAAQCPTSVGAWPYRQILIRVLKDLRDGQEDVGKTISKIFFYCLYNGYDFQLAGYSLDVCLSDLRNTKGIKQTLNQLSKKLIAGLMDADRQAMDLILLAHWDAQSYWGEMYTDLYDFCSRLESRCRKTIEHDQALGKVNATLDDIQKACKKMMAALEPRSKRAPNQLIVHSKFVGPAYQYAHGLSIYFPWSQPFQSEFWLKQYGKYKLIADANKPKTESAEDRAKRLQDHPSWRDFLAVYFDRTMRETRHKELGTRTHSPRSSRKRGSASRTGVVQQLLNKMNFEAFAAGELGNIGVGDFLGDGKVGGADATGGDPTKVGGGDGTGDPGKVGGGDGTGGDFYYSIIKNYPPFTRGREKKKRTPSKKTSPARAKR